MIDRLLRWLEAPIRLLLWIALAAGFLMMLHVSADVAGRTFFNRPLQGTTEVVAAFYMVAAAFLPWAWVARKDAHIRAELFSRIGSKRFHYWLDIAVKLMTVAYLSVFTWQTAVRALQQLRADESWQVSGGYLAVWPSRWLLPLAAGVMVLHLVLRVAAGLRDRPHA